MLLLTSISDRWQTRGIPAMIVYSIGITGWVILYCVDPIGVSEGGLRARYFACCCLASAGYANIPILMAWTSNNSPSESGRAVALGMLKQVRLLPSSRPEKGSPPSRCRSVGQCLSILASFLFPSEEGPRYIKGAKVNIAFQCLGFAIVLGMTLYYRLENARRDRKEGGRPLKGVRIEGLQETYDKTPGPSSFLPA